MFCDFFNESVAERTGSQYWLGDLRAAADVFQRMLWLSPSDNQGACFNLAAVEAGKTWEELEGRR